MEGAEEGVESDASSLPNVNHIKNVIIQRQHEMNELNNYRHKTLENLVRQKEVEKRALLNKFRILKKDFDYNLELLRGRDEELQRYDQTFKNLKRVVLEKDSLISELKSSIFDFQNKLKNEQSRMNELEIYYQEKLNESKTESNRKMKRVKEDLARVSNQYDQTVTELKQKIIEKEHMYEESQIENQEKTSLEMEDFRKELKKKQEEINYLKLENNKLLGEKNNIIKVNESKIKIYQNEIKGLNDQIDGLKSTYSIQLEEQKRLFSMNEKGVENSYKDRIYKLENENKFYCDEIDKLKGLLNQKEFEIIEKLNEKENEVKSLRNAYDGAMYEKEKEIENLNNRLFSIELKEKTTIERNENLQNLVKQKEIEIENHKNQIKREIDTQQELKKDIMKLKLDKDKEVEKSKFLESKKNDDYIRNLQSKNEELSIQVDTLKNENEILNNRIEEQENKKKMEKEVEESLGLGKGTGITPLPSPRGNGLDLGMEDDNILAEAENMLNFDISPTGGMEQFNNRKAAQKSKIRQSLKTVKDEIKKNQIKETENQLLQIQIEKLKSSLAQAQYREQQIRAELEQAKASNQKIVTEEKLHTIIDKLKSEINNERFSSIKKERESDNFISMTESNMNQLTKVNSMLTDLRIDYEKEKDILQRTEEKLVIVKKDNKKLRSRLKEAARDVKRILRDREKLLEQIKMLKETKDQIEVEYENKINQLKKKGKKISKTDTKRMLREYSSKIKILIKQNNDLKANLSKYTGKDYSRKRITKPMQI